MLRQRQPSDVSTRGRTRRMPHRAAADHPSRRLLEASLVLLLSLTALQSGQARDDNQPELIPTITQLSTAGVKDLPSGDSFPQYGLAFINCRGGGASESTDTSAKDTVDAVDDNTETVKDDSDDADASTTSGTMTSHMDLTSLFRLHNEIKAATAEPPTSLSPKGRGGALAVRKAPQTTSRPLFGAFDTSSVAPLSSRLLQDEGGVAPQERQLSRTTAVLDKEKEDSDSDDEEEEEDDGSIDVEKEISTKQSQPPQRTWWSQMWQQQQRPSNDQQEQPQVVMEEVQVMAEDEGPARETLKSATQDEMPRTAKQEEAPDVDDDEDDEEIDEVEIIVKAAKEERKRKTEESASSIDIAIDHSTPTIEADATTYPLPMMVDKDNKTVIVTAPGEKMQRKRQYQPSSPYESSGGWRVVDAVFSAGLSTLSPQFRISRHWRVVRKQAAHVTGMHGLISGKKQTIPRPPTLLPPQEDDEEMGMVRRRLAAIDRARGNLGLMEQEQAGRRRRFFGRRDASLEAAEEAERRAAYELEMAKRKALEDARLKRVQEIDELITQGQHRMQELVTEKDILQRRPNPLWNYTTSIDELDEARRPTVENTTTNSTTEEADSFVPSRQFNFPPPDLVEEYLTMLLSSGRLVKLNHTDLWKNGAMDEDEDEWLSPTKDQISPADKKRQRNGIGKGGSRWLRNGLGEKLGETVETAAYRAVGGGVMSFLAKMISSLHGINVMGHSDIRLFTEETPNLPPAAGLIPGTMGSSSYAQGAFENAIRRGSRKSKKRRKRRDESFIQRDAVVETLLSQCQIAMPLLGIFPLAWQRAMIGNVITLVTATMMDFCEGLEFQILGHRLSFSFVPITEEDMMRYWASAASDVFSRRHKNPARFEAAVLATAEDVAENLKILDRWHERILGGDALRTQLSQLVARLVLTLVDDIMSGARMDLWTTHAGGPRLIAGLEHRTEGAKPQ